MTRLLHANKCTRKLHHLILHSDIKRLSFGATFTRGTSVTWQFLETVRRITKVFSLKTFSSVPSPPLILPTPERLLPQLRLILKDSPLLLLSLMTPNVPFMYSSVCLLWLLWISPTPSAKCYTLESSRDPPWLFFRIEFHLLCLLLPPLSDLLIGPAQLLLCGADKLQRNCHSGFASINILLRDIFHFQWACRAWL